ncbi:hypothetical protein AB0O28_05250 [Microbispora sp. NPDC088329]|uniref:hypothetical protein n=1 Tax=Microbispora sp. NPDC088329 TaxID=3154869 RepID=UPI00343B41DB
MVRGDDGGALHQDEQLAPEKRRIGGSGALGDAGQQVEVAVEVARGDGANGLDVVLGRRVQHRAAAEGRVRVPLLQRVEHRGELVAGIVPCHRGGLGQPVADDVLKILVGAAGAPW